MLFADWREHSEIPADHFWRTVVGDYFLPAVESGHEARFLRDHPEVGPILADWWRDHLAAPPPPVACLPPVPPDLPAGSTGTPPSGPGGIAPAVPEPSGFCMLACSILLGGIIAAGKFRPWASI